MAVGPDNHVRSVVTAREVQARLHRMVVYRV